MRRSYRDDNGEKIYRYSIRKYHFGAASVAVAALMFFANGVAAQEAPAVSPATASNVVAGPSGNSDGDPENSAEENSKQALPDQPEGKPAGELKAQGAKAEEANQGQELEKSKPAPVGQETPQAEGQEKQDQPTPADRKAAKSVQGTLKALLANLTLDSMKSLHDEVEACLAAAKAVLDDPNATQAQVDEQVRLMEDLIRRVNQALEPSQPKLIDLGEAGSENNELIASEGSVTEPASDKNQVTPSAGGNATTPGARTQATPRELPTYTNTTEGENGVSGLKAELKFIIAELKANKASEDKIQAVQAAADKFNKAFSKGGTISQSDFDAAMVDLQKSRELIEGVLRENDVNAGEVTESANQVDPGNPRENNVTIQPRTNTGGWSGFRSIPAGVARARATRSAGQDRATTRAGGISFIDAKRHYFDVDADITSPYDKYTYVYWNKKSVQPGNTPDNVADIIKYLKEDVEKTETGFRWTITVNPSHTNLDGVSLLFTIPSGQDLKANSVTITRQNNEGSTSFNRSAHDGKDELAATMEAAGFTSVSTGNPNQTNAPAVSNNPGSPQYYKVNNVLDWIREERSGGFYDRGNPKYANSSNGYENQDEQNKSNEKAQHVVDSSGKTYYGRLQGTNAYKIQFETTGGNNLTKLSYLSSIKGFQDSHRYFGLQIYSRLKREDGLVGTYRFTLRKNGYFQVNQGVKSAEFGVAEWNYNVIKDGITYQSVPGGSFDGTDSRIKGILTTQPSANQTIDKYNNFDIRNYGEYYNADGELDSKGYENANKQGQSFTHYKGTTTITTEKLAEEVSTIPGVHTYIYVRSFTNGEQDKGTIHFVTKPKTPTLDTDLSRFDEGRHTITASNGTAGYKMVLYKKAIDGSLTKVAEKVAGSDGRTTFENVDLKLGEYVVKTVVDGIWYDYKDNGKEHKTVESDESNSRSTIKLKMGITSDGTNIKDESIFKYPVNQLVRNNTLKFMAKAARPIKKMEFFINDTAVNFGTGTEVENSKNPLGIKWIKDGENSRLATIRGDEQYGFPPNKAGIYKLTVKATLDDNTTQNYSTKLYLSPSKGRVSTTQEDLVGKANEKPTITASGFPAGLSTTLKDGNTELEWKAFLVRGGRNNDQSFIQEATGYTVVAAATINSQNGTAQFTSANYKTDKIGTEPLKVIMGLVRKGTDELYTADLVSSLSDSSVRATLPDFSKAPEFGRDETGFTAKIGHLNANKAELRYTDGAGTEHTVGFSKVGANWEKDNSNQNATIAVTADTSGGTATVHIPFGTARLDSDLKAKQKAADTNFSTESTYHVPADSSAPKVSLGDTLLPTTEATANQVLYRVKQGQDFIPKIKVWDDTGSITKLAIENTPAGVTLNKFNNNFTAQTNADDRNKYTGSTISGKVATSQRAGEHVAKITTKDAYNHEQTYYLRYQILPATVEAKQAKFPQVKSKALQDGDDASNYVQFKDNGTVVAKPAGVDVTWQTKPSTDEAGLDKTGQDVSRLPIM